MCLLKNKKSQNRIQTKMTRLHFMSLKRMAIELPLMLAFLVSSNTLLLDVF